MTLDDQVHEFAPTMPGSAIDLDRTLDAQEYTRQELALPQIVTIASQPVLCLLPCEIAMMGWLIVMFGGSGVEQLPEPKQSHRKTVNITMRKLSRFPCIVVLELGARRFVVMQQIVVHLVRTFSYRLVSCCVPFIGAVGCTGSVVDNATLAVDESLPSLNVDELHLNLGDVTKTNVDCIVPFVNKTTRPVFVNELTGSCVCTTINPKTFVSIRQWRGEGTAVARFVGSQYEL